MGTGRILASSIPTYLSKRTHETHVSELHLISFPEMNTRTQTTKYKKVFLHNSQGKQHSY